MNKESPICDMENCTKPVKYICVVEDNWDVCADHLPPNSGEYFWEVFWKNGQYHYLDSCPCIGRDCKE